MRAGNGGKVVFDIDYRPNLWGLAGHDAGDKRYIASDAVSEQMKTILPDCDLIVGTEEEVLIAVGREDTLPALKTIRALTPATIVLQARPDGLRRLCRRDPGRSRGRHRRQGLPDRGLQRARRRRCLHVRLPARLAAAARASQTAATWANACGAFAVSRLLCSPESPTFEELQYFLENGSPHRALRKDEDDQPHPLGDDAPPRHPRADGARHRPSLQLEEMADEAGAARARIARLQGARGQGRRPRRRRPAGLRHAARRDAMAARRCSSSPRPPLLDRPPGRTAGLAAAALRDRARISARCLPEWPVDHCIKCLCFYHPDDPPELKREQQEKLRGLFEAARKVGRELLIEIIAGKNGPLGRRHHLARAGRSSTRSASSPTGGSSSRKPRRPPGRAIEQVIAKHDPWCRGVAPARARRAGRGAGGRLRRDGRSARSSRASPSAAPSS